MYRLTITVTAEQEMVIKLASKKNILEVREQVKAAGYVTKLEMAKTID